MGCKAVNIKTFLCGVVRARVQKGSIRVRSRHFIKFMMRHSGVQVVLNAETMLTLLLLRNKGLSKFALVEIIQTGPRCLRVLLFGGTKKKAPIYDSEHKTKGTEQLSNYTEVPVAENYMWCPKITNPCWVVAHYSTHAHLPETLG